MNQKSAATAKPLVQDGWVRKSELDAWLDRCLPVPTRVISNEEYEPIPQTAQQRQVEQEIVAGAGRHARRLGMDRRQFLRSSCGMALAFAAMNTVFGPLFRVEAEELWEPAAADAKARFFIFDVQTHHVAMPWQAPEASKDFLDAVVGMRGTARRMNPDLKDRTPKIEDAYLENYIKEVFLDSETDVVALSALPAESEQTSVLTPDVIGKTRSWITELTRSPRVISHGYFSPDLGTRNLEYMQGQTEKLKIDAWKGYSGVARAQGKQGWRMDDQKNSYPALEYSRKRGIRNICLHKGLPFPGDPAWWNPMDICQAAKDFPGMNFLVYHSGFRGLQSVLPKAEDGFAKDAHIPWVSDFCAWKKKNPDVKNVYMEMGSTFALMVSANPLLAAHVLGMIIDAFGDDHLLWGTDSIWWGSPQWQIEAFRRLEMPDSLQKRFGYKPLTDDVKRKVFGLNAARVYGVDPKTKLNPMPNDYVERLRKLYKQAGAPTPSNTQYGWVRAESVALH
ncbi:MAG TPA: amidohydrolase family protein [Terriglobales bacterium]|nr:amidohydrolase family protein [Terriglobales bacterium]